jgi:hypothetical protein
MRRLAPYGPAIVIAAVLTVSSSCTSPLELDTPRIDSVLVGSMKLRSAHVAVESGNTSGILKIDTTAIDPWRFRVDTASFRVERVDGAPTLTMLLRMRADSTNSNPSIKLQVLDVALTRAPMSDSLDVSTLDRAGNRIFTRTEVLVGGAPTMYPVNPLSPPAAFARLRYRDVPERGIGGTITVEIPANGTHRLRIVLTIDTAE